MDTSLCADQLSGKTQQTGGDLAPFRGLGAEAQKVCGRRSRREDALGALRKLANRGGIGPTWAESGLPRAIVDALTQPLKCSLGSEARKGLGDSRK